MPRPAVLAALVAAVAICAAFAITGLGRLARVIEARPVTIAAEAARLSAALEAAPWIDAGGEGPIVWMVASPPRGVRSLAEEAARLRQAGFAVRMIVTAVRTERDTARLFHVAEAARLREASVFERWAAIAPPRALNAEQEGRLEWALASYERIAVIVMANERAMETPAYFWRANGVWRVALGRDARAAAHLRRERARAT